MSSRAKRIHVPLFTIPYEIVASDAFYAPANLKVLKKSIQQLESGKGKAHSLIDGYARKRQGTPREIRPTPRKGKAGRKARPQGGGSQQRA